MPSSSSSPPLLTLFFSSPLFVFPSSALASNGGCSQQGGWSPLIPTTPLLDPPLFYGSTRPCKSNISLDSFAFFHLRIAQCRCKRTNSLSYYCIILQQLRCKHNTQIIHEFVCPQQILQTNTSKPEEQKGGKGRKRGRNVCEHHLKLLLATTTSTATIVEWWQ